MLVRHVVREFAERGYDVLNVDVRPSEDPVCPTLIADLEQLHFWRDEVKL